MKFEIWWDSLYDVTENCLEFMKGEVKSHIRKHGYIVEAENAREAMIGHKVNILISTPLAESKEITIEDVEIHRRAWEKGGEYVSIKAKELSETFLITNEFSELCLLFEEESKEGWVCLTQDYYGILKTTIKLNEKDCSCFGDHNGMVTNPDCLIHGNRKEC